MMLCIMRRTRQFSKQVHVCIRSTATLTQGDGVINENRPKYFLERFQSSVLNKHAVYQGQLFPDRPLYMDPESTTSPFLSGMKSSAAKKDLMNCRALAAEIPTEFLESKEFKLNWTENDARILSNGLLQQIKISKHSSISEITELLFLTYPLIPLMLSSVDSMKVLKRVVGGLEQRVGSLEFDQACKVAQWVEQWRRGNILKAYPKWLQYFYKHLYGVLIEHCQSVGDLVIVLKLITPDITLGRDRKFTEMFFNKSNSIILSNMEDLSRDIGPLAMYCYVVGSWRPDMKIARRDVQSLIWESIVHHVIKTKEDSIEYPAGICIKEACRSLDRRYLKQYPYLLSKVFDSLTKVLPKVTRSSIPMATRILQGMVRSRHVCVAHVEELATAFKQVDWSKQRSKEIVLALQYLGDYGYNDLSIYKSLLNEILSPEREAEFFHYEIAFLSALVGLAYLQIYPTSLYEKLFCKSGPFDLEAIAKESRSSLHKLVYLDHTLAICVPDYKGPRLDKQFTPLSILDLPSELKSRGPKNEPLRADGTPTLFAQMQKTVLDTLNRQSPITEKFIIQKKPVLPHLNNEVIELTSLVDNKKIAMIVQDESYYMRLYTSASRKYLEKGEVYYRLTGLHRSRKSQINKLGYQVIELPFYEYTAASNPSQYVIGKLKENGLV